MASPHGTLSRYTNGKCRCIPCADAKCAYEARRTMKTYRRPVDATLAKLSVAALRENGWSLDQIGQAVGTSISWASALGRGQFDRIAAKTNDRVLALVTWTFTPYGTIQGKPLVDSPPPKPDARVTAMFARKHVRFLLTNGWSERLLAKRLGTSRSWVGSVASGRSTHIDPDLNDRLLAVHIGDAPLKNRKKGGDPPKWIDEVRVTQRRPVKVK